METKNRTNNIFLRDKEKFIELLCENWKGQFSLSGQNMYKSKKEEYQKLTNEELIELLENRNISIPRYEEAIKEIKIDNRFFQENLLEEIHKEIDKKHKLDHKEKMALFLIRVTGELKNAEDRKSAAIKGDSSSGKDNLIKTILDLFPKEKNKFITHTTPAALRKSIQGVNCIAFSEMNAHRENGANKDIVETFKQMAEGGISAEICDPKTKEPIEIKSEQKTLVYGTTDSQTDDELETRYVVLPLKGYGEKNKKVVDLVLDSIHDEKNIAKKARNESDNRENWIPKSIRLLDKNLEIAIPFAPLFKNKIKDSDGTYKYLFDYNKPRVMRDAKRLFSLTKAIAWLHQKQRTIVENEGIKILRAEPSDFLLAIYIFADFFNLSYSGLDHRIQTTYEAIKKLQGIHDGQIMSMGFENKYHGWVLRHLLQIELGIDSVNTIKKRVDALRDFQLIETHYQNDIPRGYLVRDVGYQQGVNRVSLPVSMIALDTLLTGYLTPSNIKTIYKDKKIRPNWPSFKSYFEKLTPSKLTPSKPPKN